MEPQHGAAASCIVPGHKGMFATLQVFSDNLSVFNQHCAQLMSHSAQSHAETLALLENARDCRYQDIPCQTYETGMECRARPCWYSHAACTRNQRRLVYELRIPLSCFGHADTIPLFDLKVAIVALQHPATFRECCMQFSSVDIRQQEFLPVNTPADAMSAAAAYAAAAYAAAPKTAKLEADAAAKTLPRPTSATITEFQNAFAARVASGTFVEFLSVPGDVISLFAASEHKGFVEASSSSSLSPSPTVYEIKDSEGVACGTLFSRAELRDATTRRALLQTRSHDTRSSSSDHNWNRPCGLYADTKKSTHMTCAEVIKLWNAFRTFFEANPVIDHSTLVAETKLAEKSAKGASSSSSSSSSSCASLCSFFGGVPGHTGHGGGPNPASVTVKASTPHPLSLRGHIVVQFKRLNVDGFASASWTSRREFCYKRRAHVSVPYETHASRTSYQTLVETRCFSFFNHEPWRIAGTALLEPKKTSSGSAPGTSLDLSAPESIVSKSVDHKTACDSMPADSLNVVDGLSRVSLATTSTLGDFYSEIKEYAQRVLGAKSATLYDRDTKIRNLWTDCTDTPTEPNLSYPLFQCYLPDACVVCEFEA